MFLINIYTLVYLFTAQKTKKISTFIPGENPKIMKFDSPEYTHNFHLML